MIDHAPTTYISDVHHALELLGLRVSRSWALHNDEYPDGGLHVRVPLYGDPTDPADSDTTRDLALAWHGNTGWTWHAHADDPDPSEASTILLAAPLARPGLVAAAARALVTNHRKLLPFEAAYDRDHGDFTGRPELVAYLAGKPRPAADGAHIAVVEKRPGQGSALTCHCGQWKADPDTNLTRQRAWHRVHRYADNPDRADRTISGYIHDQLAGARAGIRRVNALLGDDTDPFAIVPAREVRHALVSAEDL